MKTITLGEYAGKNGNDEDCFVSHLDTIEKDILLSNIEECKFFLWDDIQVKVHEHYPIDAIITNTNSNWETIPKVGTYMYLDRIKISKLLLTLAILRIEV